ncbi:MAG TPA: zinc ABC transporter substrate-binding protein [Candidatus Latescibacteria bacterium]|nr:zinc ABC transporter substrate-binding protein [Candidatus Latescibacterota bacterium]
MRRASVLFALLALFCGAGQASPPIRVAVTLTDFLPIVEAIGGSQVEAFSIMPPGSDPHSVSLNTEIIQRVREAQIAVYAHSASLAFEHDLKNSLAGKPSVDWPQYEQQGARLLDFPGMPSNPHGFWLDYDNAVAIARAVASELTKMSVDEKVVAANLKRFSDEVHAQREAALQAMRDCGSLGDTVVAVVPGVAYTVRNLGYAVGGILLPDEGSGQADAKSLMQINRLLGKGGARLLVCPVGLRNAKAGEIAEQLAKDTGTRVAYTRFLQTGGTNRTFLGDAAYNAMVTSTVLVDVQPEAGGLANKSIYPTLLAIMGGVFLLLIFLVIRRILSRQELHGRRS